MPVKTVEHNWQIVYMSTEWICRYICIYMQIFLQIYRQICLQIYLQIYGVPVRPLGDLPACLKWHMGIYIFMYIYIYTYVYIYGHVPSKGVR